MDCTMVLIFLNYNTNFMLMKRFKIAQYLCAISFLFLIISCDEGKNDLIGHWEMPVEEEGADFKYSYIIELNSTERTYEPESDLNGRKSFGFMDFSNTRRIYRYDIDSITYLGNGMYVVKTVEPNLQLMDPLLATSIDTLRYDSESKQLVYNNDWLFKYKESDVVSVTDSSKGTEPFGSSLKDKLLIVCGIVFLVVIYYLIKILMGYLLMALSIGAIGAVVGGLILWLLIGGLDLDLPCWLIITIMSVTTVPMFIAGLWLAVKNTKELAKAPLASKLAGNIMKEGGNKDGYIIDQYGNKSKISNVERGILGEKYIDAEDGKHYRGDWGSNEVKETE